ncbi:spore morphogenesis/germination protein YwcE [Radiobacillus deserti]|uniref:spore morphogenesis/germination protein YwcE n=1 Tax=Radiobacillus deserti TaxID=2594883 RepID=UPI00389A33CD
MVFLLAYLILFSVTPIFLWLRNKKVMADSSPFHDWRLACVCESDYFWNWSK